MVALHDTAPAALGVAGLAARVRRADRRHQRLMLLLMAPSVLFIALFFVVPIGLFLLRSVDNREIPGGLPRTVEALAQWDGAGLPSEAAYAALAADLKLLAQSNAAALVARRLNYNIPGFRTLILRAARAAPGMTAPYMDAMIAADARWGEPAWWTTLRQERHIATPFYMLAALDLRLGADGGLEAAPVESAVFQDMFQRTFWISLNVTLLCLLIGFPVACVMAASSATVANLLFMAVLLPFWSSVLVRATAWIVLLQNEGLVNQSLIALGVLAEPAKLIFNRAGLYVALTHVLLPYMILPLYAVLKNIPREHMRAAASLGAGPVEAFLRVYLPQALPGVIAGAALVFVIVLGYYVAPALVGGPRDQMIGYFVAYFTASAVNWGMASALGTILLVVVALLYAMLGRLVGMDRLKLR